MGLAAAAVIGAGPVALAASASAATPSAGSNAIEISTKLFGPRFDLAAQGAGEGYTHQKLILWRTSNGDRGQDFVPIREGTVQDFRDARLVSAAFNLHYSHLRAYELEYAPLGNDSGLCVGSWSTAPVAGNLARLMPCGVGANTVLVVSNHDYGNQPRYANILLGAGNNFSHPLVLSWLNTDTAPTDYPRPALGFKNLSTFSDGTHPYAQQWTAHYGVVGAPVYATP